jgi:hypothetical protein
VHLVVRSAARSEDSPTRFVISKSSGGSNTATNSHPRDPNLTYNSFLHRKWQLKYPPWAAVEMQRSG